MFNNITRNLVRVAHCCLLAVIFMLSSGCEAPLVLDEVEKSGQSPIRRTDNFQAVGSFGQTIVAVGASGVILTSGDGGTTWQRQEIPSWPSFLDITSCSDGLFAALAFEGEVWLSSDAGLTWSQSKLTTEEAPQSIQCDPRR